MPKVIVSKILHTGSYKDDINIMLQAFEGPYLRSTSVASIRNADSSSFRDCVHSRYLDEEFSQHSLGWSAKFRLGSRKTATLIAKASAPTQPEVQACLLSWP